MAASAASSASPERASLLASPAALAEKDRMSSGETHRTIEAVFRIERARLIAGLARLVRNVDVAAYPQAVVVSPDGKTAYVSCMHANKVAVIDIASGKATRMIDAGDQADGLAWAAGQ